MGQLLGGGMFVSCLFVVIGGGRARARHSTEFLFASAWSRWKAGRNSMPDLWKWAVRGFHK